MAEKFDETYPEDIPAISSIQLKTADGINTINSITKKNNNEGSIEQTQQELMNNKGFKMVGKKGHSFPMIQPDPVEEQKKKMMEQQGVVKPENRAGSAADRNILVNNPNNPQPMNKVSANAQGREQMFNNMASDPGQPFPDASTTPPAPIFPNQQGSFAAYANPERVSENLNSVDIDAEGGLKGMMDRLKKKRNTKVGDPVTPEKPEDLAMYDGLSKTDPPEKKKPEDLRTTPMTPAQRKKYDLAVEDYKDSTASWVANKGPEPKVPDYDSFKKAPGMHEKHTQISKANVNSAMKDDAAHASYLKRDINYDNRHGGSNKQMTADEKHISKLAGDIKYDVKKKRKYDNV